jgi:hypothetical protein
MWLGARLLRIAGLSIAASLPQLAFAALILSNGIALVEQGGTIATGNLASSSLGATAFSSSDLGPQIGTSFHVAANLNDGIYGTSHSWIGGSFNPFPAPFAGIAFSTPSTVSSMAFGRSNLTPDSLCGNTTCTDRTLGLYTVQVTTVSSPSAATPDASWTTIGTLDYQSASGGNFGEPSLRHRYNFASTSGVTGIRLLVPQTGLSAGTAVDEFEVYASPGLLVPPPVTFSIVSNAGFVIGYDGNNGANSSPSNPALVPNNLALAALGGVAFASSALGPTLGIPFHVAGNLNDGEYGNSHSWIGGDFDANPNAGVRLPGDFAISQIAWGRDNGNLSGDACGGTCTDRDLGLYTIQYSLLAGADASTPETEDAITGWRTIGTVEYLGDDPGFFDAHLRHAFSIGLADGNPLFASALRLKVPGSGLANGTAIDEFEIYGERIRAVPEPSTWVLVGLSLILLALPGYMQSHRRARALHPSDRSVVLVVTRRV